MPPKATANGKRKASSSPAPPSKKTSTSRNGVKGQEDGVKEVPDKDDDPNNYVLRKYYPAEMTNQRALQYNNNEIPRPIAQLNAVIEETEDQRAQIPVKDAVIHWYKCDLRLQDNHALHLAARKAKEANVPLICIYIVSPQDFQAHHTSAVRVDFILRTLEVVKQDLAKLDIPLYVETVAKRKTIPDRVLQLAEEWGANHIYANVEYEVDELRRETSLTHRCLDKGIAFNVHPDTCIVNPGELSSQTGNQYAVYSPWYRAWMAYIHAHPAVLDLFEPPGKNPSSARETFKHLFETPIPAAPEAKTLTDEEKKRFKSMWPPGEHEAHSRLDKFLAEKIGKYKDMRNFPAANGTAVLSVHFASGTLAARTAVRAARDANTTKKLDGGNPGITNWISEVAWRDFYKHVLAHWPFVCMNKPFKPEYTNIDWSYSASDFAAWCNGLTGYPIVDAAMRQLNHTGYMHNRCRMIVGSFLAKDLLVDWRLGERYFMEHLIDGDFASNNGGWGFSASTGVDPQPYFRIFNPLLQSEKFDVEGEYIRKWVKELKDIKGKAIHDPYGRGAADTAKKNGYPKVVVEHKFARDRALAKYKEGLGRNTT